MFDPSAPHIIILLVVVLLLFGAGRLPGAAEALGKSMRVFKKETAKLHDDDDKPSGTVITQPSVANMNPPAQVLPTPVAAPQTVVTPPVSTPQAAPAQPAAAAGATTEQRLADLQRQLADLQQQNAAGSASASEQQSF